VRRIKGRERGREWGRDHLLIVVWLYLMVFILMNIVFCSFFFFRWIVYSSSLVSLSLILFLISFEFFLLRFSLLIAVSFILFPYPWYWIISSQSNRELNQFSHWSHWIWLNWNQRRQNKFNFFSSRYEWENLPLFQEHSDLSHHSYFIKTLHDECCDIFSNESTRTSWFETI